jgi:hypothetical protein
LALKSHLLQWQVGIEDRDRKLTKFLREIFYGELILLNLTEIDILDRGVITWEEFTNYIIHKASLLTKRLIKNKPDSIKRYILASASRIPTKDKERNKKETTSGNTREGQGGSGAGG